MKKLFYLSTMMFSATLLTIMSCGPMASEKKQITSASGVTKATVSVETDLNGNTIEQVNIKRKYAEDNKAGAIKHLYIISAYSGQVLI